MTPTPDNDAPRYDLCAGDHDYPDWTESPNRSLLICSYARSGSTLLGEALYFAGGLGCPLEYLHVGFRGGFQQRWGAGDLSSLVHKMWRHRTDPSGTLAIKLFWRDVVDLVDAIEPAGFPDFRNVPADEISPDTYRALNALLTELFPNPVHVHLERRDQLRQAISGLTATQTNVWRKIEKVEGDEPTPAAAYDFDRINELIVSNLFCQAHWRAFFCANGIDPYPIIYENMISDYHNIIGGLLRRLGNQRSVPPIRMERQSTSQNEAMMRRFLNDQREQMRR